MLSRQPSRKDWKELERNYRRMIKRFLNDPAFSGLLFMLAKNLGEIYRTRMKMIDRVRTPLRLD